MTRRVFVEMIRRQIYGGQPPQDASITVGLVNVWLEQAIAIAAQKNYVDSIKLDGVAYVNGSFYTTYKGLSVALDEQFLYKISLPQLPIGIGNDEGVSTLKFKSNQGELSQPVVWLTQNQKAYYLNLKTIPNKLLGYSEGGNIFVISTILLNQYTASITMISGGDATDLDSILNVPSDYFPTMVEYIKSNLLFEKMQPVPNANDGRDAVKDA